MCGEARLLFIEEAHRDFRSPTKITLLENIIGGKTDKFVVAMRERDDREFMIHSNLKG